MGGVCVMEHRKKNIEDENLHPSWRKYVQCYDNMEYHGGKADYTAVVGTVEMTTWGTTWDTT